MEADGVGPANLVADVDRQHVGREEVVTQGHRVKLSSLGSVPIGDHAPFGGNDVAAPSTDEVPSRQGKLPFRLGHRRVGQIEDFQLVPSE